MISPIHTKSRPLRLFEQIVLWAAIVVSAGYTVEYVRLITLESSHWGLLYAKPDGDSAKAVGECPTNHWSNPNPDRRNPYGPLYYRAVHTLRLLDPLQFSPNFTQTRAPQERGCHFALQLVSLIGALMAMGLLGYLVGNSWHTRVSASVILGWSLLTNPTFSQFVFMAKPDMLLTLLCGAAFAAMAVSWIQGREPQSVMGRWVAPILWGCAVATKLNAVLFLVPLGLLYLIPFTRAGLRRVFHFYGVAIIAYIIVGYPQSIDLSRITEWYFGFGGFQHHALSATAASVRNCLDEYWSQIRLALLGIVVLSVMGRQPLPRSSLQPLRGLALVASPLFALVYLLRVNWPTGMNHFYLPLSLVTLVWFAIVFSACTDRIRAQWPPIAVSWVSTAVCFLLLSLVVLNSAFTKQMGRSFSSRTDCRLDSEEASRAISRVILSGAKAIGDPYVPYETEAYVKITRTWSTTPKKLTKTFDTFFTSSQFYGRYLGTSPPSQYLLNDNPDDFFETRDFYTHIDRNDTFIDAEKRKWVNSFRSRCGYQIWRVAN